MSSHLSADEVTAVARPHLGPNAVCTEVVRTPSGNSQETYFVTITGIEQHEIAGDLVLRRSAAGGTLEWSDRGIEVAVLGAVHQAGLRVPRVLWWEPDGSRLERSYAVMTRSPGAPPDLRNDFVCRALATDLGLHLARLHRDGVPPDVLPAPADTTVANRGQVEWWTERARTNALTTDVAGALCGWLASHVPDDGADAVLLWGDPGPHNVLTDADGAVTALLDWELAQVGHPLLDLGAARWSCLGNLDRELLTRSYEAATNVSVDRTTLDWFEVLACVSRSIMLFDGLAAAAAGRSHDPNVIALGLALVNANMIRGTTMAWDIDTESISATTHPSSVHPARHASAIDPQEAVARFLTHDVLADVADPRTRRGVKIAAALLATSSTGVASVDPGHDPWTWFEREANGIASSDERRRLVDRLFIERRQMRPLVDLFGASVAIV